MGCRLIAPEIYERFSVSLDTLRRGHSAMFAQRAAAAVQSSMQLVSGVEHASQQLAGALADAQGQGLLQRLQKAKQDLRALEDAVGRWRGNSTRGASGSESEVTVFGGSGSSSAVSGVTRQTSARSDRYQASPASVPAPSGSAQTLHFQRGAVPSDAVSMSSAGAQVDTRATATPPLSARAVGVSPAQPPPPVPPTRDHVSSPPASASPFESDPSPRRVHGHTVKRGHGEKVGPELGSDKHHHSGSHQHSDSHHHSDSHNHSESHHHSDSHHHHHDHDGGHKQGHHHGHHGHGDRRSSGHDDGSRDPRHHHGGHRHHRHHDRDGSTDAASSSELAAGTRTTGSASTSSGPHWRRRKRPLVSRRFFQHHFHESPLPTARPLVALDYPQIKRTVHGLLDVCGAGAGPVVPDSTGFVPDGEASQRKLVLLLQALRWRVSRQPAAERLGVVQV